MTTYSSSTLRLFDRHCPAALGFHESGVPRDREIFAAGIAAHAMCQALVTRAVSEGRILTPVERADVMDQTFAVLTSEGREFAGVPEPPLSPTSVAEGRDIVVSYLHRRPWEDGSLPMPVDATVHVEHGLAIDAAGEPVEYGSGAARWQAVVDSIELTDIGDEWGHFGSAVVLWEYKTAWPTDASELETMQTRGHAVLARAHWPDRTIIRRVVNLRTGRRFDDVMHPPEGGGMVGGGIEGEADFDVAEQWRTDIFATCTAMDRTREARPGAGCLGCPYVLRCEDADQVVTEGPEGRHETLVEVARRYAVTDATAKALGAQLRKELAIEGVEIDGGSVGYRESTRAVPIDNVHRVLAGAFLDREPTDEWCAVNASWLSLLAALGIGATQVKNAAKAILPERSQARARNELAASMLTETTQARFGIWRD